MNKIYSSKEYCLWWLLAHVKDRIALMRDRTLSKYGISSSEFGILYAIEVIKTNMGEDPTPSLIVKCLLQTPHAISQIIGRMEKRGLVKKSKNSIGGNSVIISHTQKGKEIYLEASKYQQDVKSVIDSLSKKEQDQLWHLLSKLRGEVLTKSGILYQPLFPELFECKDTNTPSELNVK